MRFYLYEKGGGGDAEQVSAMLRGGGGVTKRFGVVFTQKLEVLAILSIIEVRPGGGGGTKWFHSLKCDA